jgi:hypothetical protein
LGTSAQVNFLAAAANTFYLTGVQLEVGSVATPFEHRPYGMELALCQRYYQINSAAFTSNVTSGIGYGAWTSFPVQMRVAPTGAFVSSISAVSFPSTAGVFNLAPRVDGYLYEKTANATSGGRFLDSLSFTSEL